MFEGPQSGRFASVFNFGLPISSVFNWSLDSISHTPETYYASNTYAGADRNPGVIDWTGNFNVFNGGYLFFPGQFIGALELFTAPNSGVRGNPGATYCGQAIVDAVTYTWAWGAEQSLTQQVSFSANGCIEPRNRTLYDETTSTPDKMCGLKVQWAFEDTGFTWADIFNVQNAALTFTGNNPLFVNSSTGCCTHRRPGVIDWTLALTMTDNRATLLRREDLVSFRLYNNQTDYWQLHYAIFAGNTNIVANPQTSEIESQVANFSMKGRSYLETLGSITHYIGATPTILWPTPSTTNLVPGPPGKPSGVQNGNDVDLTWSAPTTGDAADGYTIWASRDGVDFSCVGNSTGTSGTDVGLIETGNYWYKVAAYNAQGQGNFSIISDQVVVS